jgi:hypothetical protein
MTRTKILLSTFVAVIFLAMQVIAVGAAPASQETTPITGTIVTDGIILETDPATGITVVVTLTNEEGTQTVRLSLDEAINLNLVKDDGTGNYVVDETRYGTDVKINPALVIPDETDGTTEEPQHPVGSAISDFFSELLGVDYETVMDYHDNGAGFGVIAQALWMTNALEGDSGMFATIMDAKLNNDFSGITLPDGSTPQNWGQFRKAVMSNREKSKENLGAIMSGRAEGQQDDTQVAPRNNGNAPDKENGRDKDKNKDKGNGNDKDKGNNKDKNKDKNKND